jgi:hypothetical protein
MKTGNSKWATKAAGASALVLVLTAPAFAQSRNDQRGGNYPQARAESNRRDDRNDTRTYGNSTYRDNQHVSVTGHVSSFSRERDGYRVQLDRGRESYWVPQSYFGRGRDLRVGISVVLGGVFRGGSVYVDNVGWPDDGYGARAAYGAQVVRGVVERVDYRSGTVWLRDDRSGRTVAAELDRTGRDGRRISGLRRGDYVEMSGDWARGGVFQAYRIDDVRNGRY